MNGQPWREHNAQRAELTNTELTRSRGAHHHPAYPPHSHSPPTHLTHSGASRNAPSNGQNTRPVIVLNSIPHSCITHNLNIHTPFSPTEWEVVAGREAYWHGDTCYHSHHHLNTTLNSAVYVTLSSMLTASEKVFKKKHVQIFSTTVEPFNSNERARVTRLTCVNGA